MDGNHILRHALELALIFPAAVYAFLPAVGHLQFRPGRLFPLIALLLLVFTLGAAPLCIWMGWPSCLPMFLFLPVSFPLFLAVTDLNWSKAAFCLSNAAMLTAFCSLYTVYLMAPVELDAEITLSPISSLVCLALCVVVGLFFSGTMSRKLPYLFSLPQLDRVWAWLFPIGLFLTGMEWWMTPMSMENLLVGRIRIVSLALFPIIPLVVWLLYQLFWWSSLQLERSNALQRQNDILRMEGKRYEALASYLRDTRNMRHDFRQHLAVISELSRTGRTEELNEYLRQFQDTAGGGYDQMCANPVIDALSAHYRNLADQQQTGIDWSLELPVQLPIPDGDLCAVFGNLLENALHAVAALPQEQRRVKVTARLLSDAIVGLTVRNPYEGEIVFQKNGLPRSRQRGHGIGLTSVKSIVRKYNGTLELKAENGMFSANVLMYGE